MLIDFAFFSAGTLTEQKNLGDYFERKGVVIIEIPIYDGKELTEDEHTDLAIEVDAEDVQKTEEGLKVYWRGFATFGRSNNLKFWVIKSWGILSNIFTFESRDLEAEAEVLWRKKLEAKANAEELAGSRSIFHKTWSRDVEAGALWRKQLEAEASSESTNFIRSWKQKIFYCFHIPVWK